MSHRQWTSDSGHRILRGIFNKIMQKYSTRNCYHACRIKKKTRKIHKWMKYFTIFNNIYTIKQETLMALNFEDIIDKTRQPSGCMYIQKMSTITKSLKSITKLGLRQYLLSASPELICTVTPVSVLTVICQPSWNSQGILVGNFFVHRCN